MSGLRVIRFPYFFRRWETLAMHDGGILGRLKSSPLHYLLVPFFMIGQVAALLNLLRRERFDLIHAHWLIPQGLSAVLGLAFARCKAPVLCTSHGGDLFALRGRLFHYFKRLVMSRSKALTVVSRDMQRVVIDMGVAEARVRVIPMGVDLGDRFTPDPAVRRSTDELLFVGRLVEKKGVGVLLEAMTTVLAEYPAVRLNVAGGGPLEEDLRKQAEQLGISDRVEFLGMVAQARLPGLYRRATIAIFPFVVAKSGDQEGFGLVQVEAMGCECPVIASDLPVVHDIITHEKNGLLVPSGHSERLAQAIIKLLSNPHLRERLAREARASVMERFDWETVAEKYAGFYRDLGPGWS